MWKRKKHHERKKYLIPGFNEIEEKKHLIERAFVKGAGVRVCERCVCACVPL
jgi:hypothetical protein